jgi:hypothetical protein
MSGTDWGFGIGRPEPQFPAIARRDQFDEGEKTMGNAKQQVPGEHHPIYCALKMRCFYCGFDAAIVEKETAFWAYRQFDVDHVVPKKMFNSICLKAGLGTVVDKKYVEQAAWAIEEFNQVPACHSCNILLNAYPNEAHADKVEGFLEFFSKTHNKPEKITSDRDMNTPGHSALEANYLVAALAPIGQAILSVWEDKRGVLIERSRKELDYYNSLYVKQAGMPALDSLGRADCREVANALKSALEQRWQALVRRIR